MRRESKTHERLFRTAGSVHMCSLAGFFDAGLMRPLSLWGPCCIRSEILCNPQQGRGTVSGAIGYHAMSRLGVAYADHGPYDRVSCLSELVC